MATKGRPPGTRVHDVTVALSTVEKAELTAWSNAMGFPLSATIRAHCLRQARAYKARYVAQR